MSTRNAHRSSFNYWKVFFCHSELLRRIFFLRSFTTFRMTVFQGSFFMCSPHKCVKKATHYEANNEYKNNDHICISITDFIQIKNGSFSPEPFNKQSYWSSRQAEPFSRLTITAMLPLLWVKPVLLLQTLLSPMYMFSVLALGPVAGMPQCRV